jgi:hypothetical protein
VRFCGGRAHVGRVRRFLDRLGDDVVDGEWISE